MKTLVRCAVAALVLVSCASCGLLDKAIEKSVMTP